MKGSSSWFVGFPSSGIKILLLVSLIYSYQRSEKRHKEVGIRGFYELDQEVIHYCHIRLTELSHVATSNYKEAQKYSLPVCSEVLIDKFAKHIASLCHTCLLLN